MGFLVSSLLYQHDFLTDLRRVVAIVVGFGGLLLFFFVPETFWDRTPRPKSRRPTARRSFSNLLHPLHHKPEISEIKDAQLKAAAAKGMTPRQHMLSEQKAHAHFQEDTRDEHGEQAATSEANEQLSQTVSADQHAFTLEDKSKIDRSAITTDGANDNASAPGKIGTPQQTVAAMNPRKKPKPTGLMLPTTKLAVPHNPNLPASAGPWDGTQDGKPVALPAGFMARSNTQGESPDTEASLPHLHNLNSPYYLQLEKNGDYLDHHETKEPQHDELTEQKPDSATSQTATTPPVSKHESVDLEKSRSRTPDDGTFHGLARYTTSLRTAPPKSYMETLRPWNGRLNTSSWLLVALRPFILFAYPSIMWSALVYSLSIGWLIVLSESITNIYKSRDTYNFTSLQAGLVYVSPFIGGILGTAVAGKVSDIIIKFMARKNGGVYEPEFRLVMAIPVAISTVIGLMGFGWSAEERDLWIVPTIFFGIISFGCSLGSTTAITFCVDSYRQYAGEALVTLNFSKNIFHGLVFSLFFANWLESDGPKTTFLAIGGIQMVCMLFTIPMYIYGKRARMWTVRKNFIERF